MKKKKCVYAYLFYKIVMIVPIAILRWMQQTIADRTIITIVRVINELSSQNTFIFVGKMANGDNDNEKKCTHTSPQNARLPLYIALWEIFAIAKSQTTHTKLIHSKNTILFSFVGIGITALLTISYFFYSKFHIFLSFFQILIDNSI